MYHRWKACYEPRNLNGQHVRITQWVLRYTHRRGCFGFYFGRIYDGPPPWIVCAFPPWESSITDLVYVCVLFTSNRSLYPSTSSTPPVRMILLILERHTFCGHKLRHRDHPL
ncbi:unnamed protein product [Laminaria digitata]